MTKERIDRIRELVNSSYYMDEILGFEDLEELLSIAENAEQIEKKLAVAVEAVEWLLPMAHNLLCLDKELPEGLHPMFYQTLSYSGDLELRNRYHKIKEQIEGMK